MILALVLGSVTAFLITFLLTPFLINAFKKTQIVGEDVHKASRPIRAEMGGVGIVLGFCVGFSVILVLAPNYYSPGLIYAFLTIIFIGVIGVFDDLFTLRQRYKPLLTGLASLPLLLVCTGRQGLWFPFIGSILLGAYWLFVLVGVTTAANMTNLLAGFNGLESGIGAISCFALGIVSVWSGNPGACLIAFPLSAAFFAFLKYNWFPAKIFPGDTGTLVSGAAIATIAVYAGIEFAGLCMIAPCAIDFTLKLLAKKPFSQRRLFGDTKVNDEGVLSPPPYPAFTHAFMRVKQLKEKELVSWFLFMQLIYASIGVLLTL